MVEDSQANVSVLLVEDSEADSALFAEKLNRSERADYTLKTSPTLAEASQALRENRADVVVVDLGLPDSDGIETLRRLYAEIPSVPIIVITGQSTSSLGVKAIQEGAQDFLIKDEITTDTVARAIHYAVERSRIQAELEAARFREEQERELGSLARLTVARDTDVAARMFNVVPLREGAPMQFAEFVRDYEDLLEDAVEQQLMRTDRRVEPRLKEMARRMSRLRVAPRDLVDVHIAALKSKSTAGAPQRIKAMSDEGRIVLLELMGYLASEYRIFAIGRAQPG